MPKTAAPRSKGTSEINGVPVAILELDAKTKDSAGKETKFTYQFPKFADDVSVSDLVKALTYKNGKGEEVSGESVLRDYANTAIKNEKRSSELAKINGVLKLREDPEAAIKSMVDMMVMVHGVKREVAEANVRALIAQGSVAKEASASA